MGSSALSAGKECLVGMKRKSVYRLCAVATACTMAMSMTACSDSADATGVKDFLASEIDGTGTAQGGSTGATGESAPAVDLVSREDMFTDRDLSGEYDVKTAVKIELAGNSAKCDSPAVQIADGTVTISGEGTYILSGEFKDGMIVVAADDAAKVQLVLNGATISNSTNAAIYVKSADKAFVTLAEGSSNSLSNGGSYTVLDDNNIDGVIFSKSDIVVNGSGSLDIIAAAGHGIVSKDDLKVAGGRITITAAAHALNGKDSVRIAAGTITVTAGKDGIHTSNEEDAEKGYVYIADGTLNLEVGGDGVDAVTLVQIDGGDFTINAGGGNTNKTVTKDEEGNALSTKGIKAGNDLVINGGSFTMNTQDDALHSNANLTINGGEYQIATGDDAVHSEETTTVAGGTMNITASYEGIEGKDIAISGGYIKIVASDDGINAAGGNDQSGFGGMFGGVSGGFGGGFGGGGFGESTDSSVVISGGTIYMDADGDGLDSNGSLIVTGGEVYVSGPENGGNGALDYGSTGQAAGGTVVAVGSMQMAMNFDSTSTQGSILINTDKTMSAGTTVVLNDATGKELVSYVTESSFNSVLITSPLLTQGETYTISVDGSDTTVILDSLIYGSGSGMGGFGGMGGPGGFGGGGMGGGNMGGGRGNRGDKGGTTDSTGNQNGQSGNGQMPDMSQMPGGEMPSGEMPDMSQMPNMGEMPQMPGGTMPGGQMPGATQEKSGTMESSSAGSV